MTGSGINERAGSGWLDDELLVDRHSINRRDSQSLSDILLYYVLPTNSETHHPPHIIHQD